MQEILKLRRRVDIDGYIEKVRPIVEAVRKEGDEAVIRFTMEFDGVELDELRVSEEELDKAYEAVDDSLIDALEIAKENIHRFHYVTAVEREMRVEFEDCVMGKIYTPVEKVGAYIPGGRASYPSTALMIGVPQK